MQNYGNAAVRSYSSSQKALICSLRDLHGACSQRVTQVCAGMLRLMHFMRTTLSRSGWWWMETRTSRSHEDIQDEYIVNHILFT